MADLSSFNFSHQDLRNHSFKRQTLCGANFSYADLRGCDFSQAQLQGASFEGIQAGKSLRQISLLVMTAAIATGTAGHAISQMVFGAMGRTVEEGGWSFILALYISLGISGAGTGLGSFAAPPSLLRGIAMGASGLSSAALLAFFYAGRMTDNNPDIARIAAVTGGIGMAFLFVKLGTIAPNHPANKFLTITIAAVGTVAAYGVAFWVGTLTIAHLFSHQLTWGMVWGTGSLSYLWFTMRSLLLAIDEIQLAPGTLFTAADLTAANFHRANLGRCDFSGAIGFEHPQAPLDK